MFLIVGLGNPGKKYEKTRHNLGFQFLDFLKNQWELPDFELNLKLNTEISKENDLILAKPQTFMNRSGQAVRNIINFYKVPLENLLIIHDDLDINCGEFRSAFDSSSAGHNGVKNIIEELGSQEFRRLRIGIRNEELRNPIEPSDFVLRILQEEERKKIEAIFPELEKLVEGIIGKK